MRDAIPLKWVRLCTLCTGAIVGACFVLLAGAQAHAAPGASEPRAFVVAAGPAESPGAVDGTGREARLAAPLGLARDADGNLYVADSLNNAIRKISPGGRVTTLAGLAPNYGSTDGPRSKARFCGPAGVAVDASGCVYVADYGNQTIRKISPAGLVSTFAGQTRSLGSADGRGAEARFHFPCSITIDSGGNLYVADRENHTIRKLSPEGEVTTLAGSPRVSGSTDGFGNAARFYHPCGVAADAGGNVYVADAGNHTIRKVTPSGEVSTLAGLAGAAGYGDGLGAEARFNTPQDLTVDKRTGDIYVSDSANCVLRKIDAEGRVSTARGLTTTNPWLGYPWGIVVDESGTLFVAQQKNHTVVQVPAVGFPSTWAGEPGGSGSADAEVGAARFRVPGCLATDRAGNVYVADTLNHTVRKLDRQGLVSTLAGLAASPGSADGTGEAARFNCPAGLAIAPGGEVYLADWYNHAIRRVGPDGKVTTLAGMAGQMGTSDGSLQEARFWAPADVALAADGRLIVADSFNFAIRQITPAGEVTTLAGRARIRGSADGPADSAQFSIPTGVAVAPDDTVFVADCGNHTIRRISPAGTVTTLAGLAGSAGSRDGTRETARFYYPAYLALDEAGNLYVADSGNHRIRKIAPDGTVTSLGEVTPWGGYQNVGYQHWSQLIFGLTERWHPNPDFRYSSHFRYLYPLGLAVSTNGYLYTADNLGHSLWRYSGDCADRPVIDAPVGVVGVSRQLDTAPQTAVSLRWSLIRRPAGSQAELSSQTIRNPIFAPDVADLYVFQLRATNAAGGVSVSTLEFEALEATPPSIYEAFFRDGTFQVSVPTAPGKGYVLEFVDSLPGTTWTELPPVTGDGSLKLLADPAPTAPRRFYRVRLQ